MQDLYRIQQYNFKEYSKEFFAYGLENLETILECIILEVTKKESDHTTIVPQELRTIKKSLIEEGVTKEIVTKEIVLIEEEKIEEFNTLLDSYETLKKETLKILLEQPNKIDMNLAKIEKLLQEIEEKDIDKYKLLYLPEAEQTFQRGQQIKNELLILKRLIGQVEKLPKKERKIRIAETKNITMKQKDKTVIVKELMSKLRVLENYYFKDEIDNGLIAEIKQQFSELEEDSFIKEMVQNIKGLEEKPQSKIEFLDKINEMLYQMEKEQVQQQEKELKKDIMIHSKKRIEKIAAGLYKHLYRFVILNNPEKNVYYYTKGIKEEIKQKVSGQIEQMIKIGKLQDTEKGIKVQESKTNEGWEYQVYEMINWLNELEQKDKLAYYFLWLENKYVRAENANNTKERIMSIKIGEKCMEFFNERDIKTKGKSFNTQSIVKVAPYFSKCIGIKTRDDLEL